MPLSGQASGGWTESSSALRILHVGIRNTTSEMTADALTQTNPVLISAFTSDQALTQVFGVLSGSVAFTRPAALGGGSNEVGGPFATQQYATSALFQAAVGGGAESVAGMRELGVFINNATGNNAYDNKPGVASNINPYVSAQGTYGNQLFETQNLSTGADLSYSVGDLLYASCNGFLTNGVANDRFLGANATVIGILKMPPDSTQDELVYDQRI
jgi:hypothetical protein